ncbi:MAG: hypothetical protein PHT54_04440, partial [Candidatus Nanoarchaeia archaeon]|nr:hypothetical protein [Candidatus Nanoarchaeia archaeon]
MNQENKFRIFGWACDIDETIAWTARDWAVELIRQFGAPEGLSAEEIVKKYNYVQDVPDWKNNPEAMAWIKAQRANGISFENLSFIEGAVEYVNLIHRTVLPLFAYVTSRGSHAKEETRNWLSKNFPLENIMLVDRPGNFRFEDQNVWKASELVRLYDTGVEIMVDDNLGLIPELEKLKYKGTLLSFGHSAEDFKGSAIIKV